MQRTVLRRPWFTVQYAITLSILVLVIALIGTFAIKNPDYRLVFSDVYTPLINAFATLGLFMAARHSSSISKRMGNAWRLLAFAQLAYTIGDVSWAVIELGLKQTPYPSFSDIWYLLYYPLFMIGAFLLSSHQHSRLEWTKRALDAGIIIIGALLGFGIFLLSPSTLLAEPQTPLLSILNLAYPVSDLVLVAAILWLMSSNVNKQMSLPILLLVCSSLLMILCDSLFSYQSNVGIPYFGGGLIDFGYLVSYVLTGMAGFYQANTIKFSDEMRRRELPLPDPNNKWQSILAYMPYAWVFFAYALLIYCFNSSIAVNISLMFVGVGVMVAMVILRQFIALQENRSLNIRLQKVISHVQKQTLVLEETNSELENEIMVRKQAEEQLSYDALHDSLTDLPNRSLFNHRLEHAIKDSKLHPEHVYSILFMDIDQFKVINDSLGHDKGDQLLVIMAQRLKHCLRESDIAARLGGDEFVVLLENTSDENVISFVVNRIQEDVQKVIDLNGHAVFITTSIGIVLSVAQYETPGDVLRDADIAMYSAKAHGKNCYEIFHDGMRAQAFSRLEIEEDLRSAITNNEFELFYQPILNLDDNELIGFESLIRWIHPVYGLLQPNDFISVSEESGLILQIGQWVLVETCTRFKKWQKQFSKVKHFTIHANISGKQFSHPQFIDQVVFALEQSGLEGKYLKLEITESVLIDNYMTAINKFEQLEEIGVQLVIDDFGTGYSSLAYVQNFPIHTIKIDKSFVRDIGKNKKALELIRTIVSMAHDLGMHTIAEGIENVEQYTELRKLACQFGQGYFLSQPLNLASATALLNGSIPSFPEVMPAESE